MATKKSKTKVVDGNAVENINNSIVDSTLDEIVNHENLNWHYLVSCDVKEGENDVTELKTYGTFKLSTGTIKQADMERALRQIQPDGEKSDDENLRKATKEVEATLITAIQSVRVNNGTLVVAHSSDDLGDKEIEERLNSKPYSYVKKGIIPLN